MGTRSTSLNFIQFNKCESVLLTFKFPTHYSNVLSSFFFSNHLYITHMQLRDINKLVLFSVDRKTEFYTCANWFYAYKRFMCRKSFWHENLIEIWYRKLFRWLLPKVELPINYRHWCKDFETIKRIKFCNFIVWIFWISILEYVFYILYMSLRIRMTLKLTPSEFKYRTSFIWKLWNQF